MAIGFGFLLRRFDIELVPGTRLLIEADTVCRRSHLIVEEPTRTQARTLGKAVPFRRLEQVAKAKTHVVILLLGKLVCLAANFTAYFDGIIPNVAFFKEKALKHLAGLRAYAVQRAFCKRR